MTADRWTPPERTTGRESADAEWLPSFHFPGEYLILSSIGLETVVMEVDDDRALEAAEEHLREALDRASNPESQCHIRQSLQLLVSVRENEE